MADWKKLYDAALELAKAAAPLAGPAGAAGVLVIERAAELVDSLIEEAPEQPPEELEAARARLDAAMNKNVDEAIDQLRGD